MTGEPSATFWAILFSLSGALNVYFYGWIKELEDDQRSLGSALEKERHKTKESRP
jgi:hypothetical protein